MDFKNKKVIIMGLGLHGGGLAVAKWLLKQGAYLTVTDLRTKDILEPSIVQLNAWQNKYNLKSIKYILGKHRLQDFKNHDLLIRNPSVPIESRYISQARKNNIKIYNEASLFFNLVKIPIIGITGAKGKSTTTALTGKIFKKYDTKTLVGGNIRDVAMFDIIDKILVYQKIGKQIPIILELSSWHLENLPDIKRSPHVALITNIYPEHLNRYKNYAAYRRAKEIITKFQSKQDYLLVNNNDKYAGIIAKRSQAKVIIFSRKQIPKSWQIKMSGDYNLDNIAAAIALAKLYKIPNNIIKNEVENFKGLNNRLELIRAIKKVNYYNDTTATAPIAAVAALKTFPKKIILITGGSDKGLPLKDFAKTIKAKTKYCIFFKGQGSEKLLSELKRQQYDFNKVITGLTNMTEAVALAKQFARPGDFVLLSPGFASFSAFKNEFDRGDQFNNIVRKLQ